MAPPRGLVGNERWVYLGYFRGTLDLSSLLQKSGEGLAFWSTWHVLEALDLSPFQKLERDLHFGRSSL